MGQKRDQCLDQSSGKINRHHEMRSGEGGGADGERHDLAAGDQNVTVIGVEVDLV